MRRCISTLTTGADNIPGNSGNDLINGALGNNGTSNTWQTWDTINGGSGTDTLTAELLASTIVMTNVSSVEKINLNIGGVVTIDAVGANFINTLTVVSDDTLTINNLGSLPVVNLSSTGATTLNVLNSALSGTNNLTVNLTGGQNGDITITDTAGSNTLESITLNATSTNTIGTLTASGLGATTLSIGGSGQLTITTLTDTEATIKTINGSTNTGGFNVSALAGGSTVTGGSGNDSITGGTGNDSISCGAGNDTLTFAAGNLTSNDTVNGGEGVNTLVADKDDVDTVAITTAWTNTSNLQTLQFSDALAGDTITTANIASSINRVNLSTAANAGTINFAAGSNTLATTGANGAIDEVTADASGTGTSDSLTVLNARTAGQMFTANTSDLTVTDFETVTINTGTYGTAAAQLVDDINIGTANALTITGNNGIDQSGNAGVITARTIDASGLTGTGALVMGAAAASGLVSIIGSANADTLIGDASSSIVGGAGNDSIDGGAENDTLLGEAGEDSIDGGAGNDSIDGGIGNDTVYIAADANLNTSDTIKGGEGEDTLTFEAAITNAAATLSRVSEFEVLALDPGAAQTLNMANFTNNQGFTRIDFDDAAGGDFVLTNVNSTVTSIRLLAGAAGEEISLSRLINSDTSTLTISARAAINAVAVLTVDEEETLNISGSSSANDLVITSLEAADLTTINVTGAADITITDAIVGSTDLATINASGSTGAVDIDGTNSTVNITATAGTGNNTLETGSGADLITGNIGNDVLVGNGGIDTINGGSGTDEIEGGAGADRLDGGSGADDYNYTALNQGGNVTAVANAAILTAGDTIVTFVSGSDDIDVAAITDTAATGEGAAGTWDLDVDGAYVITTSFNFILGESTTEDVSAAIGVIEADAAINGVVAIFDNQGTASTADDTYNLFQINVAAARGGVELTGLDTISLIAVINSNTFVQGDFIV